MLVFSIHGTLSCGAQPRPASRPPVVDSESAPGEPLQPKDTGGSPEPTEPSTEHQPGAPGEGAEYPNGPAYEPLTGAAASREKLGLSSGLGENRPAIESVGTWEEVRRLLPKDLGGGVDWVQAIKEGVVAPHAHLLSDPRPERPFTLDTLVQGNGLDGTPPLDFDVQLIPAKRPFFKVVFPHSSHSLWLNCSSCHPGIVGQRPGMKKILEGEYCGKCHGKVSFAPETSCWRCHPNLAPPGEAELAAEMASAEAAPLPATPEMIKWGKNFYEGLCVPCHGEHGDGDGPFAAFFNPRPRDFRDGSFKFRTTPSGSLPTDLDLFRTITAGLKGTSMPSWFALGRNDRWALVHYIKTFSEVFDEEEPDDPIEIPDPPPRTPEQIAKGKEAYRESKCWDCHGNEGKADGPSAGTLTDDWEFPILPADFTRGFLKSGSRVEDVFRSISTGLDGSPMPSYGDITSDEERWAISYYILSLADQPKGFGLEGNIHFRRYFREAVEQPPAMFPHWFHRIRFRCSACHPGVFRMKAGANPIKMEGLRAGEFCARCHNSRVAWHVGFDTCRRCHGGDKETVSTDEVEADR